MLAAHALLLDSTPKPNASVAAPPQVVLRFNGRIEAALSSVALVGGPRNAKILLLRPRRSERPDVLIYDLPSLEPGAYRIEWKALSVDGHLTDGVLKFTVVEPTARPAR